MEKLRPPSIGTLVIALALPGCGQVGDADTVWVTIPHGAPAETIADSLVTRGLIGSVGSFRWYVKFAGVADSLKPGSYEFAPGASLGEIVDALREGRSFAEPLHIIAGSWRRELASSVAAQLGMRPESVVAAVGDTAIGFLLPGVYHVRPGATAHDVVRMMVAGFERRWRTAWDRRLDTLGMSRTDLVTFASIVEGEGAAAHEMATVASVYHNRLRLGMRLQADPTVAYALGERRRLFNRDYRVQSPHNTYLIHGLPPTPIANPSIQAIEATLYPATTDFLYFVAAPDGEHRFSRTYAEHLTTIQSIRGPGGEIGSGARPQPQTR